MAAVAETRTDDFGRDAGVRAERVRLLYSFPQRVIGNAINAALVAWVVWGLVDRLLLLGWLLLQIFVAALRMAMAMAYRRRPPADDPARWERYFVLGTIAAGLLWGASSSIVWLSPEIASHVFIAFVIAGTTSAAASMSYPSLPAYYWFAGLAALPLAVGYLLVADTIHVAMGLMTLLLVALLSAQARVAHATMLRSFRLQEDNRDLVRNLSAARDNLEARVGARTAELDAVNESLRSEMAARLETESRLKQSQKMEAIGQLTGGLAHDFNNLLAVIQGNAELLAERATDERERRELQAILRASTRGAQLTQRLLAFSRKQALQPQAVDVNDLIGSMTEMLGRTLGGDVSITVQAAPNLPPALVDPGQLENAILNLAINARDAMPGGGVLRISSDAAYLSGVEDEDMVGASAADSIKVGRYVVVEVADTGKGIPKDQLDKVWEPFFTTKKAGEGTGLGLSMVYGFVRQSGGQIKIESTVGKGTTVKIYLPCAEGDARKSERADVTGIPGGNEYVFVIDDDPEILSLVEKYLARLGYQVVAAGSAEETFEKLAQHGKPDIFLSDVVLPGGNRGPAIVAGARRTLGPVKAVFMSGHAGRNFAEALGPDEKVTLLNKPFELPELARVLRRALDSDGT
jgi:signal transduction histidine kinase